MGNQLEWGVVGSERIRGVIDGEMGELRNMECNYWWK